MIPFTRYWVWNYDNLAPIGSGFRTVRVTYRKKDILIRELWDDETSVHLTFGQWNQTPHIEIVAGQTISEVLNALRTYKEAASARQA